MQHAIIEKLGWYVGVVNRNVHIESIITASVTPSLERQAIRDIDPRDKQVDVCLLLVGLTPENGSDWVLANFGRPTPNIVKRLARRIAHRHRRTKSIITQSHKIGQVAHDRAKEIRIVRRPALDHLVMIVAVEPPFYRHAPLTRPSQSTDCRHDAIAIQAVQPINQQGRTPQAQILTVLQVAAWIERPSVDRHLGIVRIR